MADSQNVNDKEENPEIAIEYSKENRPFITTSLEIKILQKLDDIARERKSTRSNIMRLALLKYMDQLQKLYKDDENNDSVSIRTGTQIDPETLEMLNLLSYKTKIPKAEILRQAILLYVSNYISDKQS